MSIKKSSTNKENYNNPDMGKRIKNIRGGMSQSKFAELLDSSQGTVAKYEKGMLPSVDILLRIAQIGNTTIEWLRTGEGEMFPTRNGEPLTGYAVNQVHRALDPEDEKLLEIMKGLPRARDAMEAFLALSERKQKIHLGKMLESLEEQEEGKK